MHRSPPAGHSTMRSEEHTSELQSLRHLVCRLLLEKKLEDLNAGNGAGGEFLQSDAAYVEWNRRLASWIENVDALNSGEVSFFFNDTATTEIYTLSLHDALPI